MNKKIYLGNGQFTLVSEEDFIFLSGYSWNRHRKGHAQGRIGRKHHQMSRVIAKRMGLDLSKQIDHIDRNPLNNCRNNLRSATNGQNRANSKGSSKCGFKGVHLKSNRWYAQITINKKKIYLGYFDTPVEAHLAYCEAAKKYHGEFANFS